MAASLRPHSWDQGLEVSVLGAQPLTPPPHGDSGLVSTLNSNTFGHSLGTEGAGECGPQVCGGWPSPHQGVDLGVLVTQQS